MMHLFKLLAAVLCCAAGFDIPLTRRTAAVSRRISLHMGMEIVSVQMRGKRVPIILTGDISEAQVVELQMLDVLVYSSITVGSGEGQVSLRVQMDTGSSTLAVPGVDCMSCGRRCSECAYNPSRSPSSDHLMCSSPVCQAMGMPAARLCRTASSNCTFVVRYADGSRVSGPIVSDTVTIGTLSTSSMFGVITSESPAGQFSSFGIDGILGLANKELNFGRAEVPTLFDDLVAQHRLGDVFGMAVGDRTNPGKMTVGYYDEKLTGQPLQWTPMVGRGWYMVELQCVSVGSKVVGIGSEDLGRFTIVDSGTTITLLPNKVFMALRDVLETDYGYLPHVTYPRGNTIFDIGSCYSNVNPSKFPTLYYSFAGGVVVPIPPETYFSTVVDGGRTFYCFGVAGTGQSDSWSIPARQTILGDTFMSALYVVFDRKNRRVGFSPLQTAPGAAMNTSAVGGNPVCARELASQGRGSSLGLWLALLAAVTCLYCCCRQGKQAEEAAMKLRTHEHGKCSRYGTV